MGSAYGGKWRPNPNKPQDMAFVGQPNTIRRIYIPTKNGGYWAVAKFGEDGWAVVIRHETEHSPNEKHTNPHDHFPVYDPHTHAPLWKESREVNYPDGAPEFKQRKESNRMPELDRYDEIITDFVYDEEAMRFKTIAEFKYSITNGGEVVIEWGGVEYGIFRSHEDGRYYIGHDSPDTNVFYDTPDELLEHRVGENRLREVITKAVVVDRFL